jgi:hypothetical protein
MIYRITVIQMIPGVRVAGKRQGEWALRAFGPEKNGFAYPYYWGRVCFDWGVNITRGCNPGL